MRRLCMLFIALLLPLQFAWSAAAGYCQHEGQTDLAKHFGHHEHVHKAEAKKAAPGGLTADSDCGVCMAVSPAILTDMGEVVTPPMRPGPRRAHLPARLSSAFDRAPDRPQWGRLA